MKMRQLTGTKIHAGALSAYTWNADLIAFDGPLLSLFKRDNGADYLFAWLDSDDRRNRWAAFDVNRDALRDYLSGTIPLLTLFQNSSEMTVFDTGIAGNRQNARRMHWESLPAEYLPRFDSFFSETIATPEAVRLIEERSSRYSIKLNGELYLEDLASIPKVYQQLYSIHYGLHHLDREAVRNTISSVMHRWNGGFTAVNLFGGLQSVTPKIHRAQLKQLHYNSPGHITMELLPEMAARIKAVTEELLRPETRSTAEALYKEIYKYFREEKISGFEDEKSSSDNDLTTDQLTCIGEFTRRMIRIFKWEEYEEKFLSLRVSKMGQLRVLLAYYRRLRKIIHYSLSGNISLT